MAYDCIIIGGGLSGLTCGIKCAEEGLRTAVISSGMNSLHFSSGSIDVFGYRQGGGKVYRPFDYMKETAKSNPAHPYSRIGAKMARESLEFFNDQVSLAGISLHDNGDENHFRITGLGVMKPTYFSQDSVFNDKFKEALEERASIAVLNFDGYRDYYAELTVSQLRKNPVFKKTEIITGKVTLPFYTRTEKNLHEFRSIDLARVFDTEKYLPRIAEEIKRAARGARVVSLPAFIGIDNFAQIHKRLENLTGCLVYEIPSLPPSILGLRLDNALRSRFAALGGEYSGGDRVNGGELIDGVLDHVHTENYGDTRHRSRFYVMSTGSFFSAGLRSGFNVLDEPVLGLRFSGSNRRSDWYSAKFFDRNGHPFLKYGVETNKYFNPFGTDGKAVKNLFCTGAMLSGYDPIREGSGGGVAISTGYFAAKRIIGEIRKNK